MIPLKKALTSSIGKKYVMGVTGLSLLGFMVTHLLANLTLYVGPETFNQYPHELKAMGPLLTVAEIGLLVLFATHIVMAGVLFRDKEASSGKYVASRKTKGGNSRFNLASTKMSITGGVLFLFLLLHVAQFRFAGLWKSNFAEYTTTVNGEEAIDLYRLVAETFQSPVWVAVYVVVMLVFGMHIRHGFWSAFQSLGAMKPEWSKQIYAAGAVIAAIFTIGFLFIPIYFLAFVQVP